MSAPTFTLRPLDVADIPMMAVLDAACFPEQPFREAVLYDMWRFNTLKAWGAEAGTDGSLVGYIIGRFTRTEAELWSLAVLEPLRRYGVATAMMQHFNAAAQAQGIENVHLEVRVSNEGAHAFYERLGAERVGRRKNFYAAAAGLPAEDAYLYMFRLV